MGNKKRSSHVGTNVIVRGATQLRRPILIKKPVGVATGLKASLTHYSGTAYQCNTFHPDNGGVSV